MMAITNIKNSLLALAIGCIAFSCSKSSHWSSQQVHSDEKDHASSRLTYYSDDEVHGVDVEFIQTREHLNVYLNVHSIPVPAYEKNPTQALVTLKIGDETISRIVYRLSGGQRFLLSKDTVETLVNALKNQKEITLTLASYRTILKSEDFLSKFHQLVHPSSLQNPFHLPF